MYLSPLPYELFPLGVGSILALVLAAVILIASLIVGQSAPDTEKISTYECGFDPYEDARNAFDVRFYLVAILFLLFDLEALFLFPWAVCLGNLPSFSFWAMVDFLGELGAGFIYAWRVGALEWS
jgi:NADH-quinone oxidoreductase subunit A